VLLAIALVAAAVALNLPLGGSGPQVIGGSPLLGKPAPAIDLATLEGTRVQLADYRGRPVMVNFWASIFWSGFHNFRLHLPTNDPARPDHTASVLSNWVP
jgi:cytochrome c biogenesis protein CcmG/thiol:disulfide interchange protein DsbE